jgi:hypothetical protein
LVEPLAFHVADGSRDVETRRIRVHGQSIARIGFSETQRPKLLSIKLDAQSLRKQVFPCLALIRLAEEAHLKRRHPESYTTPSGISLSDSATEGRNSLYRTKIAHAAPNAQSPSQTTRKPLAAPDSSPPDHSFDAAVPPPTSQRQSQKSKKSPPKYRMGPPLPWGMVITESAPLVVTRIFEPLGGIRSMSLSKAS